MSASRWTDGKTHARGAPPVRLRRGGRPAIRRRGPLIANAIALLAAGALHGAVAAQAAEANGVTDAEARYRQERERCERIEPPADRATCVREAAAARAEARHGRLADRPDDPIRYIENALKRCEPLPSGERADCEYRVRGGGTARGSVEAGGIYRETVTREIPAPTVEPAQGSVAPRAPSAPDANR